MVETEPSILIVTKKGNCTLHVNTNDLQYHPIKNLTFASMVRNNSTLIVNLFHLITLFHGQIFLRTINLT